MQELLERIQGMTVEIGMMGGIVLPGTLESVEKGVVTLREGGQSAWALLDRIEWVRIT